MNDWSDWVETWGAEELSRGQGINHPKLTQTHSAGDFRLKASFKFKKSFKLKKVQALNYLK